MNDKVLAEFLIHLHSEAKDLEAFTAAVKGAAGGDFPKTLIESLDRLMRVLKSDSTSSKQAVTNQKQRDTKGFPGLSIPDDPDRISRLDQIKDTYDDGRDEQRNDQRDELRNDRRDERRNDRRDDRSSRHGHKHDRRRDLSPVVEEDEKAVVGKVYPGRVINIKDFGVFVSLSGIRQRTEGLVHISNMQDRRVSHPSDVVQRGDKVFVKLLEINGDRIRLSMKDADQKTGLDLTANAVEGVLSTDMGSSLINSLMSKKTGKKRMSSPERFEIKQLIAAGVVNPKDYPELMNQDLEENGSSGMVGLELEEEIDIELKEEEPLFLKVFKAINHFRVKQRLLWNCPQSVLLKILMGL
jgi:ATP-dependent RNA helicase DHX8/PRP22